MAEIALQKLPLPGVSAQTGLFPHILFLFAIVLWCAAGPLVRHTGVTGLLGFTAAITLYFLVTNALYVYWSLLGFVILGIVYVVLSYADVLPDAWTIYYDRKYILSQSFFVFLIYPLVCASKRFWLHAYESGRTDLYMGILFFTMLGGMVWFNLSILNIGPFVFWGMQNPTSLLLLSAGYFIFIRYRKSMGILSLCTAVLIVMLAANSQAVLVGFMLMMTGVFPGIRKILVALVILIIFVSFVGYFFVLDLLQVDQNTAFRYLLWGDAFSGFFGSHMLGIGFGKEVVTNQYLQLGVIERYEDVGDIMKSGVHNSFIGILFRMGLAGFVLFVLFIFKTCFPFNLKKDHYARYGTFLFFIAFTAIYINVGMESPLTMVGVCTVLGYILALKRIAAYEQSIRDQETVGSIPGMTTFNPAGLAS